MKEFIKWAGLILSSLIFSGCATVSGALNPQSNYDFLARNQEFQKEKIPTSIFTLTGYSRIREYGKPLTIYIEGDGRAWLTKNSLSPDPTPFHPLVMKLAVLDSSENVAYLGRPCQFDNSASRFPCEPAYWSNKRFSEEVIASINEAVNYLSLKVRPSKIDLVGYSGGGAVAVLVAARRSDIASIRTVAGNLDPQTMNRFHQVDALSGSLNPLDAAKHIANIPQRHFIGAKDTVIPRMVSENYMEASGQKNCVHVTAVPAASHHEGWVAVWKNLMQMPVSCEDNA